jgi:type IV pilus assembly protein PilA
MDVRLRWSQLTNPTPTAMLELLVCLCVMGAMIGVAARGMQRVQQRLYVMEAVSLMTGPKIAMMEYRAVTGIWPTQAEDAKGSLRSAETTLRAGAVDYTFSDRVKEIAGKVLTIRAWQGPGAVDLPIAWLCGRARAAPMAAASDDRTSLGDDELPSPCRVRQ